MPGALAAVDVAVDGRVNGSDRASASGARGCVDLDAGRRRQL